MDDIIRFIAQVYKVSTLADGGIRITLDLPETEIETMSDLARVRQQGAVLEIAAVPVLQEGNRTNGKIPTRSEWKS